MSVNAIMPNMQPISNSIQGYIPEVPVMPMVTPAYAQNGQLYPVSNSGKIIGGTIGSIAGLSSSGSSGIVQTGVNTATMTAIGVGIGAAVDYMINKQREQIANKVDYKA